MKSRIIPQAGCLAGAWLALALAACGEAAPPGPEPAPPRPEPAPPAASGPEEAPPARAPGLETLPQEAGGGAPPEAATRPALAAWARQWRGAPPAGWPASRLDELAAARDAALPGSAEWIAASLAVAEEEHRLGRFGPALAAAQAALAGQRRAWATEIASGTVRAGTPSPSEWLPRPLELTARAALWLALELEALAPGRPAAALWPPGPDGRHRDPMRAGTAASACREILALRPDQPAAAWWRRLAEDLAGGEGPGWAGRAQVLLLDLAPGRPAGDLAAGDFDGDGLTDLMVSDAGPGPGLTLLRGDGHGRFALASGGPALAAQPGATGLRPADLDGDGSEELLMLRSPLPGGGGAGPLTLLTRRAGRLVDATPGSGLEELDGPIHDAAWADMDGDGDTDLLLAGRGLLLLLQDRPGHWRPAPAAGLEGPLPVTESIRCADLDGDGDIDVHLLAAGGDRIYRNDGGGRLIAEPGPLGRPAVPGPACFLDFDGDGDPDLLHVPGPEAAIRAASEAAGREPAGPAPVLLRNDRGVLAPWPGGRQRAPVLAAGALACGDADGDGRGEAWVAAADGGRDLLLPHRLLAGAGPLADLAGEMPAPVLPGQAAVWLPAGPGRPPAVALLLGSRVSHRPRVVLWLAPTGQAP